MTQTNTAAKGAPKALVSASEATTKTERDGPVLVIGATGQQGGATVRALMERGWRVRALVRDSSATSAEALHKAGAALVAGDLDDPESLRTAMKGVHGVFLVLNMMTGPHVSLDGVAAEVRRGTAVADLAAEANVAHLVYSSIQGADERTGVAHVDSKGQIEERIRDSGVPATILRPVFLMENFLGLTRPAMADGGLVVRLPLPPWKPLAMVAVDDIGAFAAIAFTEGPQVPGKQVDLAGDFLTGPEVASAFGRATGIAARFEQVPFEQVRAFDEHVAAMWAWLGEREAGAPDLPGLRALHPALMTFAGWLNISAPSWLAQNSPAQHGPAVRVR